MQLFNVHLHKPHPNWNAWQRRSCWVEENLGNSNSDHTLRLYFAPFVDQRLSTD